MECERLDSLDGWVAVRPNVFEEAEHYKLGFIVAWNQVESKFAVTCHNRTLQRRRRREEEEDGAGEQVSWAGLYSVLDLEHIHHQLSSVCGVLEHCLPNLPAPNPAGSLWTLLFPGEPSWEASPEELEAVCRAVELYLGAAIEHCGRKIVLDVLFPEELQEDERYFEDLHEFRRKSLEERVTRAKEELRRVRALTLHTYIHTAQNQWLSWSPLLHPKTLWGHLIGCHCLPSYVLVTYDTASHTGGFTITTYDTVGLPAS